MIYRIQNSLFMVALSLASTVLVSPQAVAQDKAPVPIVVLDLSKVFDSHPQFQAKIERIKQNVKTEEAKIQQQGEQLKAQVERLQTLPSDSAEFKQLEVQVATAQARVQADMQLKRKGFLEEEAKVYYETYQEIKAAVKSFAESNRIGIVLRYSSEEIDQANRQSVLQGINQPIVYNQGGLDVTNYIIDRLKRSAGATAAAGSGRQRR